jgi:hypothetical protein
MNKRFTEQLLCTLLMLVFLGVSQAFSPDSPPTPPEKPPHTIWIEAEDGEGTFITKDNSALYGGRHIEQAGPGTIYWDFVAPESGYYSFLLGAQSTTTFCSPYNWWIDVGAQINFNAHTGNGQESAFYYETGHCWHFWTPERSDFVLLEEGPHRLYIEFSEPRAFPGGAININFDAIAITFEGGIAAGKISDLRLSSPNLVLNSTDRTYVDLSFDVTSTKEGTLTEGVEATLEIFDLKGKLVKTIANNHVYEEGQQSERWDGTDNNGKKVTSGMYIVMFSYKDVSYGKFQKAKPKVINVFFK